MLDGASRLKLTNARLNPFEYTAANLLPTGSVLSRRHLRDWLSRGVRPATCRYTSAARGIPFPILPFQVFGVAYDLDLVVVADHPKWTMHEFARVPTSRGPVWMAKESDPDGVQTVLADGESVSGLAPEVDVPRVASPVSVEDRSRPGWVDVSIRYRNSDGEEVGVDFEGPTPRPMPLPFLRNGNTMGHSRKTILAILDIVGQSVARTPRITIGGKPVACVRLFWGAQPFAYALEQVQGGLSAAEFIQRAGVRAAFTLARTTGITEKWLGREDEESIEVAREDPMNRISYRFLKRGPALELSEATVTQAGRSEACLRMRIEPSLPDLAIPFEGRCSSRFVIDVNGRPAHGSGTITVEGDTVEIRPEAPRWAASRPIQTQFAMDLEGQSAHIKSRRV